MRDVVEDSRFVLLIVAGLLAYALFRLFKFGFKGSFFGAKIARQIGEVEESGTSLVTKTLRVHLLASEDPARAIGIELSQKSLGGWSMTPFVLSFNETQKLIGILQKAISDRGRSSPATTNPRQ